MQYIINPSTSLQTYLAAMPCTATKYATHVSASAAMLRCGGSWTPCHACQDALCPASPHGSTGLIHNHLHTLHITATTCHAQLLQYKDRTLDCGLYHAGPGFCGECACQSAPLIRKSSAKAHTRVVTRACQNVILLSKSLTFARRVVCGHLLRKASTAKTTSSCETSPENLSSSLWSGLHCTLIVSVGAFFTPLAYGVPSA